MSTTKHGQLSHSLQQMLKKLLLTISKGEKSIERQRQTLAQLERFEPYAAFQRIDRNNDGLISSVEIVRFLRDNGVDEATEADCHYIVKYFDSDEDGSINYQDFLQMLMPCDDQDLRACVAQRPNYCVSRTDYLGAEIEAEITKLFEKEIAFNRVCEEMKQRMESCKQFDYAKAFHSIDDWNYGYVDRKNLKSFLRKHGYLASSDEVMSIIRRMDLDGDARLNKEEFISGLHPAEPYSKMVKRSHQRQRSLSKNRSQSFHTTKQSAYGSTYFKTQDLLGLSLQMKDPVRVHAMDRSFRREGYGKNGSPLKLRPNFRGDLSVSFATPKSLYPDDGFYTKTPKSQKGMNASFHGMYRLRSNKKSQKQLDASEKKIKCCGRSSYLDKSLKQPGARKTVVKSGNKSKGRFNSKKRVSQVRQKKTTKEQEFWYEPITRGRVERSQLRDEFDSTFTRSTHLRIKDKSRDSYSPLKDSSFYSRGSRDLNDSPHLSDYSDLRRKNRTAKRHQYDSRISSVDLRRETQLTRAERDVLANILIDMVNFEKDIEDIKIELSLKEDFNLIDGFGILDPQGKGFVSATELRERLLDLGLRPTIDEIHLVFQRFNRDHDGMLKYSEFSEAMMPQDQHFARLLGTKRIGYLPKHGRCTFDKRTMDKYLKVWEVLIHVETVIEGLRQRLYKRPNFNIDDAFRACDFTRDGFISISEMKEMMNECGMRISMEDLHLLLNRFDKDKDGKIAYREFAEELTPKSPFNY